MNGPQMRNPEWDRPGDERYGPKVFSGDQIGWSMLGEYAEVGPQVSETEPRDTQGGIWAKITAQSGSFYTWTEVQQDSSGHNWVTADSPLTGTLNAVEHNNNATTNGTVVWMRRTCGGGGEMFTFQNDTGAVAGSTITVDYCDGTGTIANVATLGFDKAVFVVTNPAPNTACVGLGPVTNTTIVFVQTTFNFNTTASIWNFNVAQTFNYNAVVTIQGSSYVNYFVPIVIGAGAYLVQQSAALSIPGSGSPYNNVSTGGFQWVIVTNSAGGTTITGIQAPTPAVGDSGGNTVHGRLLEITNLGSGSVFLSNLDTNSGVGNRIQCINGASFEELKPGETALLKYYVGSWPNPNAGNFWVPLERLPHYKVGVNKYYRSQLELVAGANVTLTPNDQAASDNLQVTIAASGGGFAASESGIGLLGGDVNISFTGTVPGWTATGCQVTLPTAGATYLLIASVNMTYQMAASSHGGVFARMFNTTTSAVIGSVMTAVDAVIGTGGGLTGPTNVQHTCCATVIARYTTAGANEVVRVEGNALDQSPSAYIQAKVNGAGNANTSLMFWRVA